MASDGMQAVVDVLGPYTLSSTMLDFRGLDVAVSNAFRPAFGPGSPPIAAFRQ